jgi:hypothetical protein
MDIEEKRKRQREAAKRWRERNPEKVIAANRKKRVRIYEPEKRKEWREARLKRDPSYRIKTNDQAKKRKEAINEMLRKHKLSVGCASCGSKVHHAALEFHHVGNNKEINLSFAKSMAQAQKEMSKCEVLCANCHRILHWTESHPCKLDIFELTYEVAE